VKYCSVRSGWRIKREICWSDKNKIRNFDNKMKKRPNIYAGLKLAYEYIELLKNLKKFCQKKRSVDKVRLELQKMEETNDFYRVVVVKYRQLGRHSADIFNSLRIQIRNKFIGLVMQNSRKGYCQCPKLYGVFRGLNEKVIAACRRHC
jgi:hypothetical protein